MNKIKILIADNRRDTRELIKTYLAKDRTIKVIDEAENGKKALELSLKHKPDILLIYYNMIELDSFEVTEKVTAESDNTIVIMTSEKEDVNLIKKAMVHGAKEYIKTPFYQDELIETIRAIYDREFNKKAINSKIDSKSNKDENCKVISVFSTKGGVGKSTIAINTALALQNQTGKRVALIDLDLQFGDVLLMVNKEPINSIVDFINQCDEYTLENLKLFMQDYRGISILPSPISPEFAEYITDEHIREIIKLLKQAYDYVIIDNPNSFDEVTLAALDLSNKILLLTTMDIVSIKNVKVGLRIMKSLGYANEKVNLIINKANEKFGIKLKDLNSVFDKPIDQVIVEDIKTVVTSINKGTPFVLSSNKNKISKCISKLAKQLTG